MDKKFPIIDSSMPLIKCVKRMNNKHEACLVVKKGYFYGILGYNDILRGLMYSKNVEATIDEIKIKKNFAVVEPNSDVYGVILLMKNSKVDFILVKRKRDFVGIVTKKEIAYIEPDLFENLVSSARYMTSPTR